MKIDVEYKKMTVDPATMVPEITVAFTVPEVKDIKTFKQMITDLQLNAEGQKKLPDIKKS